MLLHPTDSDATRPLAVPSRVLRTLKQASLPLLVYDLPTLRESVRTLTESFPRYFFPVKCNPHPSVLRAVLEAGGGFSARTLSEVRQAVSLGVRPGKLSFTGWGLGPAVMKRLIQAGAEVFLDSAREVRTWMDRFREIPFGVRILAGASPAYLNAGFTPSEIAPMLDGVRRAGGRLRALQVHFPHESPTASGMIRDWSFLPDLLGSTFARSLADIELLNLGGGWPGASAGNEPMDPSEVRERLTEGLLPHLARAGFLGRVAVEPGRFVAAPCGWWASRVIRVHDGPPTLATLETPPTIPPERTDRRAILLRTRRGVLSPVDGRIATCRLEGVTPLPFRTILHEVRMPRPRLGDVVLLDRSGAYMERALNYAGGGIRVGEIALGG